MDFDATGILQMTGATSFVKPARRRATNAKVSKPVAVKSKINTR